MEGSDRMCKTATITSEEHRAATRILYLKSVELAVFM